MSKSAVAIMMIITGTLVTSIAFAAQRSYAKQVSAPSGGQLMFDSNVGSVTVVGQDAPEVIVHAQLDGSKSFLDRFHIIVEETPSGVTISGHLAATGWYYWYHRLRHWLGFRSQVRFDVGVPSDYPVRLRTSGGDVDLRNLKASVRIATSGGNARIQDITGEVGVRTSGGNVDPRNSKASVRVMTSGGNARFQDVTGGVRAHTSGGDIVVKHLMGPAVLDSSGGNIHVENSAGDLDVRTGGGDVHMQDDDGSVHALTSGGDIWAELPTNRGIRFRTGGGDITLLLPENTRASIDAESSGSVTSELSLRTAQIATRNHVLGTFGSGGATPIFLRASGGDIRIGTATIHALSKNRYRQAHTPAS